jgi:3-phenylpropionate/trans-cinnamate dioxygenase ferredoxin reductase component
MSVGPTIVIIGGGQAGLQAAWALREQKFSGRIVLVGEEASLPYQRPPLSKGCIEGSQSTDDLLLRPPRFFSDHDIEVRTGERIVSIDPVERRAISASGSTIPYDHLVLATGSRNRLLNVDGGRLEGVHYLRSIEDAAAVRHRLLKTNRLVIIGGGFIGLEVAAVARKMGVQTTIVDVAQRLMARAVSSLTSEYFHDLHVGSGVTIRYQTGIRTIVGEQGAVTGALLDNGELLEADQVLVGIGAVPNIELAQNAGLDVNDGIVVDEFLTASDPNISAIGDCARFPFGGGLARFESVQNAVDQGRAIGAKLAGRQKPYAAVPWFWSDQGSSKLQIAGYASDHDEVLLSGELRDGLFSVFCFRRGVLVGVESVNRPLDHIAARRMLQSGNRVTTAQLLESRFDLKTLLSRIGNRAAGAGA